MINDRKRHLDYILSLTERKGRHLLWKGPVGFAGLPVLRGGDGNNKSPHHTIYFLRTGKDFPRYRTEGCSEPLCVEPSCFKSPRTRVEPQSATSARAARRPKRNRSLCVNGHSLAETRLETPGGKLYCGTCVSEGLQKHGGGRRAADICSRGHDQSLHGRRRNGGTGTPYCLACNRERKAEAKSGNRSPIHVV